MNCLSKKISFQMSNHKSFIYSAILLIISVASQAEVAFPGKVIAASPDPLTTTVGSPSIAVLPDGTYVASHDWGGDNLSGTYSSVYSSTDKGITWQLIATVKDIKWANLFVLNGNLYLMGVKTGYGDICIRRSADGGKTWTTALGSTTGILFKGRFHTGPVPVVIHNGRIWRAFEESPDTANERDFRAFVVSAPVNSDLLNAANWNRSPGLGFDPDWLNATSPEWCEGNVVVTPEDSIVDFMRVGSEQETNGDFALDCPADGHRRYDIAAKIHVAGDNKTEVFNPFSDFTDFPGASTKFTIRYDSVSKKYWTIANRITTTDYTYLGSSNSPRNQRNVLVLYTSSDLQTWEEKYIVIRWNEGKIITRRENFGFQYADWQIDGNDIVAVVRTSWYGSDWHDSNMMTFHRIPGFRTIALSSSPADLSTLTDHVPSLLEWQFTSPATTGKELASSSTTTNPNLNVSVLTRGSGLTNTVSFARSFSAATDKASVEDNSKTKAVSDNQYFQFTVQAKTGYSVSISTIDAKLSRNSEGPSSYRWQYSLDGTNFIEISSGDVFDFYDADGEGTVQTTIRLDSYGDLQNVSSSKQVTFRIYFWRATLGSGRVSFGRYSDTIPSLKVGGSITPTSGSDVPIAAWTFSGITGVTTGNLTANTANEQVQTPVLKRGSGLTPVSLSNAYYSYFSANTANANGKNNAIANNDYYTFTIQAKAGYQVSFSSLNAKLRRNSNGPLSYRWMYSLDNINFKEAGNNDIVFLSSIDNGVTQASIDLSSVAELQKVSSSTPVTFRLYAWGSLSTSGGLALGRYTGDNCLSINGKVEEDLKILNSWQFYDDNGTISTGRETSYTSTTTDSNVVVSNLIRGTGNVITSSGHTGGFIGYMTISANKQEALSNNCYYEFNIQAQPGSNISLYGIETKLRRQEFSASTYRWMYSLDGTGFTDLGTEDVIMTEFADNTGYVQPALLLNGNSDLQNLPADKPVIFRLYAWGGTETATTRKHFGFGQSKLAAGPSLKVTGSVRSTTTLVPAVNDSEPSFRVVPDPDGIRIFYSGQNRDPSMVEIKDILGRSILCRSQHFPENEHCIKISCKLYSGIYILSIIGNKTTQSMKFIK
jgi:hypothetical protein